MVFKTVFTGVKGSHANVGQLLAIPWEVGRKCTHLGLSPAHLSAPSSLTPEKCPEASLPHLCSILLAETPPDLGTCFLLATKSHLPLKTQLESVCLRQTF